jgi:hypothetical protein
MINFSQQKRDQLKLAESKICFPEINFPFIKPINETFYFKYNSRTYYRKCLYKGEDANFIGFNIAGKAIISIGEDRYLTAFENLEVTECKKIVA